jgi:hypothetical protein
MSRLAGIRNLFALLACVACAQACDGSAGSRGVVGIDPADTLRVERDLAAPAQTDSLVYHASSPSGEYRTVITVQYRNVTAERISFPHCKGDFAYGLQQRVDSAWVDAWAPDLPMCLSFEPIAVDPGATIALRFAVYSGRQGSNLYPQFYGNRWPPGIYRIDIGAARHGYDASDPVSGRPVPVEARVSNAFVLR